MYEKSNITNENSMKAKLIKFFIPFFLILFFVQCAKNNQEYTFLKGQVFGTYYSITYLHPNNKNFNDEITKIFVNFSNSLSVYDKNSIVSRINENDPTVETDQFFEDMFNMAKYVSEVTSGAFDITVAPLVNGWGFGIASHNHDNEPNVDSLLSFVGYEKIYLQDHKIVKLNNGITIDPNAIAKGQAVDVVADFLEKEGCEIFMIEIGGEIYCKGLNPKNEKWHIGIDKPIDNANGEIEELQTILKLSNIGLATSGNYRQFYIKEGKKYAHTIDPRSGFPVHHNLLSATVIAPTSMKADAFATAFMVLGVDSTLTVCNQLQDVECFLIFEDFDGSLKTTYTAGFEKYFDEDWVQ